MILSSSDDVEAREAVRAGLIAGSAGALSLARSMSRLPFIERRAKRRVRSEFPRPLEGIRVLDLSRMIAGGV